MQARLEIPAALLSDAVKGINLFYKAAHASGVDPKVLELVHLRASQINGCGPCVDMGARAMRKAGESDERMMSIAAWRETPYYTEPERAALNLAEYATRLADKPDAVPDQVWDEAAKHFNENELSGIVLWIAVTNLFNRINVTTRTQAPQNW